MNARPWCAAILAIVAAACGAEMQRPAGPATPRESSPSRTVPTASSTAEQPAPSSAVSTVAPSPAISASATTPAAPAVPIIDIAIRLAAWKSRLEPGYEFGAEKVVPGFGYAFANNRPESQAKAVIVTTRGEIDGPWTERTSEWGHGPAIAMVDAGDLNGDGEGDLLMTWGNGSSSGAIYLSTPNGPVEAWKTGESGSCYSALLNGKPAVYVSIPGRDPEEDPPSYKVVTWNGQGFTASPVASIPDARRPSNATPPFTGECSAMDDHTDGSMGGSWFVSAKVRDGRLASVFVVGNQIECSGRAENLDIEIGKQKTLPFTWSFPSFQPDKPPKEKRGSLKLRVRDAELQLRGRLCGNKKEVDTVARCTWVGPDNIAGK